VGMMLLWIIPMFQRGTDELVSSLPTSSILFTAILGLFQMFSGIAEAVSYALLRQDKDGVSRAELARIFE
ncbi:MAG TPA: hypothetical protein VHN14_30615, partial [Kofleriaceae bacterium]|nr:hypothetical protein [Kofleriaceae bacterium]